jgi:hypothetical protein
MHSQLLEGFKCESQTENSGKAKSRGKLPGSQHFRGVEEMGLGRVTSNLITRSNLYQTNQHVG